MEKINQLEKLSDKSFRSQLRKDPKKHIVELFSNNDTQDIKIVVKTNTKNTVYVVFPDANHDTDFTKLGTIRAAGVLNGISDGVSTASTVGTVGTLISSVSSAGSWGTASSK